MNALFREMKLLIIRSLHSVHVRACVRACVRVMDFFCLVFSAVCLRCECECECVVRHVWIVVSV